ncbi:unnamed protein product, partial [Didymodactylos carnosus]
EMSTLESSLPNELFDFIFLYLKPIDIVYSFFNLNGRFNNLVYPFICTIDLSNVDECTLNKYCQTILPKIHHYIKSIKVDDKNIGSVFPLWLYSKIYPNLQSLFITIVEKDDKYLSYLKLFKQLLNLRICYGNGEDYKTVSHELCSNLFQSDCRLQTLYFQNIYVPINPHIIQRCVSIRKLIIKLHSFDSVYVLLNNLPSIESVNIHIPQQQQQNDIEFHYYDKNIPLTLPKLKELVFYGTFSVNYDYLELLLSHWCSNLEYLALNLYIDQFIDGERLEKKLLSKLTKLIVFHFCFRIRVVDNTLNIDDYIQTYKSSYWINNNHSILCFNQPLQCPRYCVFSLPYMFDEFTYVTNDLVNYRSNVNDNILLHSKRNKAKKITLHNKVPYTLELFQIIQKSFPRAKQLVFIDAPVHFLSDNLLNNLLVMKKIICMVFYLDKLNFLHFRQLLLMTPNVLILYTLQSLMLDVLRNSQDSSFQPLQSICDRIRDVRIGRRSFEYDALNDNRIKLLFPNAKISGWINVQLSRLL